MGLGVRGQAGKHRPADVVQAAAEARRLHGFAGSQRIAAEHFGGTDRFQVIRVLGLAADRMHRVAGAAEDVDRSEEHTSELQSLMRISYAVFCLKNQTTASFQDYEPTD